MSNERKPILGQCGKATIDANEALESSCGIGTVLFAAVPHIYYTFFGAETTLLSIVGIVLRCHWGLGPIPTSLLQMEVIAIAAFSCFTFSNFADRCGRKPLLLATFAGVLGFGLLSGTSNNMWVFVTFRGFIGLFLGPATATAVTLISEVTPSSWRSYAVAMCSFSAALGTMISCFISYLTLNNLSWKATVMLLPGVFLFVLPIFLLSKESPRWDVSQGRVASATHTLGILYKLNGDVFQGELVVPPDHQSSTPQASSLTWFMERKSRVVDLMVVVGLAGTSGGSYYAAIFGAPRIIINNSPVSSYNGDDCTISPNALLRIMVSAIPEALVSVVGAVMMNRIGRRGSVRFISTLQTILIPILFLPVLRHYENVVTVLVMMFRCTGSILNTISIIVISEYFPTRVRSTVEHLGIWDTKACGCGAILASQYLFDVGQGAFVGFMLGVSAGVVVLSVLLRETVNGGSIDEDG